MERMRTGSPALPGTWRRTDRMSPQIRASTPRTIESLIVNQKPSRTWPKWSPMRLKSKYWLMISLICPPVLDSRQPVPFSRRERAPRGALSPACFSQDQSRRSLRLVRGREHLLGRLLPEPLLVDLRIGPVVLDVLERGVDVLAQSVVVLLEDEAVLLVGRYRSGDLYSSGLFHGVLSHRQVDDCGIRCAGLDRVDRIGALGELADFAGVRLVLDVRLAGCPLLHRDRYPRDVVDGLDVAADRDHEGLLGQVVRIREVNRLLALPRDRRRRGDYVELALGEIPEDRVERGVLVGHLATHVLGDRVQQVDVEPGVIRRLTLLERRVRDIRADRERAGVAALVVSTAASCCDAGDRQRGDRRHHKPRPYAPHHVRCPLLVRLRAAGGNIPPSSLHFLKRCSRTPSIARAVVATATFSRPSGTPRWSSCRGCRRLPACGSSPSSRGETRQDR